eukprot:m.390697 g.390697  ORF g.390697 m.390697 type:complete len:74 (+) comp16755_c0_seq1:672-893(+)
MLTLRSHLLLEELQLLNCVFNLTTSSMRLCRILLHMVLSVQSTEEVLSNRAHLQSLQFPDNADAPISRASPRF